MPVLKAPPEICLCLQVVLHEGGDSHFTDRETEACRELVLEARLHSSGHTLEAGCLVSKLSSAGY